MSRKVTTISDRVAMERCLRNMVKDQLKRIKELKAENERLKKYETIYYLNQLQASNEDVDKFRQNQIQQSINISDLLKDNAKQVRADERKRVVGEIKEKFKENLIDWYEDEDNANKELYLDADELWIILDQIEKGEGDV